MSKKQDPYQHLLELLTQVVTVAKAIAPQALPMPPRSKAGAQGRKGMVGIHSHQSKYNPWRAYICDTRTRKSVYLGAFPSIAKCKAAQKAYREGQPVRDGTRAGPKLALAA